MALHQPSGPAINRLCAKIGVFRAHPGQSWLNLDKDGLTIFNMYMNSLQLEFSVLHPMRTIVVQNAEIFNGIIAARDFHEVDNTMTTEEYAELRTLARINCPLTIEIPHGYRSNRSTNEQFVPARILSRLYSEIRNSYIVVSPYIKDHRRKNIDSILNRIERPETKVKDIPLIGMRHVILEIQEALFETGAYSWIDVVDVLPSDTEATSG